MPLSQLPQFIVEDLKLEPQNTEARIAGRFDHLRGVRNIRGWLYRADGISIIGDLLAVPARASEPVVFLTSDASLSPELGPGSSFPWLDGYWQPYHVTMVLAPSIEWDRRAFIAEPAQYFTLNGVTGWQPIGDALPSGAVDLGVRDGAWDHEHCELCRAQIGAAGAAEGFVHTSEHWLCVACYERYAVPHDLSFATEA